METLAGFAAPAMIGGGGLLRWGKEAALAPLAKVYRRLPAEPFETAPRRDQPQEIVVRTLSKGDKTYFYAVNPTPWPLTAHLQFSCPSAARITPYCEDRQATVQATTEAGAVWSVEMEQFALVGAGLSRGIAKI